MSKVCDGRKDCSDGSDETIGLCARNDEYRKKISVKQYRYGHQNIQFRHI